MRQNGGPGSSNIYLFFEITFSNASKKNQNVHDVSRDSCLLETTRKTRRILIILCRFFPSPPPQSQNKFARIFVKGTSKSHERPGSVTVRAYKYNAVVRPVLFGMSVRASHNSRTTCFWKTPPFARDRINMEKKKRKILFLPSVKSAQ